MSNTPNDARVRLIGVNNIHPNPHNPRRLFDEEPMRILEESINKLGILVPVTVYRDGRDNRFILLDGERRWKCAQALKLSTVPAIVVAKPSEERNILTMFHIHNLREGWQLMPTALKLKTLMDLLHEDNERSLTALTKLSIPQIRRCKILLSYPKRFQNMMLAPPSERMKADFFIELDRIRRPALAESWAPWEERGDPACIEIVLNKYENKVINAVTEFRILAEVYRGSVRLGKTKAFMKELDRFLDDPEATVEDVAVPGATFAKELKEIGRTSKRLIAQIQGLEVAAIAADEETIRLLKRIRRLIDRSLSDALVIGPRSEAADEE